MTQFRAKTGWMAAIALVALVPGTAHAGWKLVPHYKPAAVGESALTVTPANDWNRLSTRPVPHSEVWTLDGLTLNELYFAGGLEAGATLMRDAHKKDHPLPKFADTMQVTDIPEFFESSLSVGIGTASFVIDHVAPTQFAGHAAVEFEYHFTVNDSALVHRGTAIGTIVDKHLYLASFTAPEIYYFDHDVARVKALLATARL